MRARAFATVASMVFLTGCAGTAAGTGPAPGDQHPSGGRARPYSLYTHCGIGNANIGGRRYLARPQLSRSGNPPRGWGNPYQRGTIRLISRTEVVFRDSSGHRVLFVLRPGATGPTFICS